MNKLIWYLKQLLPLTYRTTYGDEDGNNHFCVWNMWFGKCFNIQDYVIVEDCSGAYAQNEADG